MRKYIYTYLMVLAYMVAGLTVGTLIEEWVALSWQYWVVVLCLASVQILSALWAVED